MIYKTCPQCGQPIKPPLNSLRRQICYQCGWSGEKVEIVAEKVEAKKLPRFRQIGIIVSLSLALVSLLGYCHYDRERQIARERAREEREKIETALVAIEKIDSSLGVGINITEYERLVLDAKYPLDALAQLDTDGTNAEVIKNANRAFSGYLLGLRWWRCKIEGWEEYKDVKCWDELLPEVFAYSDFLERVIRPKLSSDPDLPKTFDIDGTKVLQRIWEQAELSLDEARSALVVEK